MQRQVRRVVAVLLGLANILAPCPPRFAVLNAIGDEQIVAHQSMQQVVHDVAAKRRRHEGVFHEDKPTRRAELEQRSTGRGHLRLVSRYLGQGVSLRVYRPSVKAEKKCPTRGWTTCSPVSLASRLVCAA